MIDPKIWEDQQEFNEELRGPVTFLSTAERMQYAKDVSLHLMTEVAEYLNALGTWETNRRKPNTVTNHEHIRRQLIDVFKCWMTLAQLGGYTSEELTQTYFRKSLTVRQRYSEEFLVNLNRPAAILDLDGVLVDYIAGFSKWCIAELMRTNVWKFRDGLTGAELTRDDMIARIKTVVDTKKFMNAENVGVQPVEWWKLQSLFRVSGGFATLPPMPHLAQFAEWLASSELLVIGLTSRSIDLNPNIIDDTLHWLSHYGVHVDCMWWGVNKGEKLASTMRLEHVKFVVDDDPRYLEQYVTMGVPRIYWMRDSWTPGTVFEHPSVVPVESLLDIIRLETT